VAEVLDVRNLFLTAAREFVRISASSKGAPEPARAADPSEAEIAAGQCARARSGAQWRLSIGARLVIAAGPQLKGLSILVVEDDYCLADDASRALARAGAKVMGPCAGAEEAMELVDRETPDCVLLDLNLGRGLDFAPARALAARGVPIVFVTGYDALTIPHDLAESVCLQKPTDPRSIVAAVRTSCGR
jgi:CheY-like chemotaxis protein